jgi:hypothetical protein
MKETGYITTFKEFDVVSQYKAIAALMFSFADSVTLAGGQKPEKVEVFDIQMDAMQKGIKDGTYPEPYFMANKPADHDAAIGWKAIFEKKGETK